MLYVFHWSIYVSHVLSSFGCSNFVSNAIRSFRLFSGMILELLIGGNLFSSLVGEKCIQHKEMFLVRHMSLYFRARIVYFSSSLRAQSIMVGSHDCRSVGWPAALCLQSGSKEMNSQFTFSLCWVQDPRPWKSITHIQGKHSLFS